MIEISRIRLKPPLLDLGTERGASLGALRGDVDNRARGVHNQPLRALAMLRIPGGEGTNPHQASEHHSQEEASMITSFGVAVLAGLLGLAFLLVGCRFFMALLPIWGFFAGFCLGAMATR
jgi:hypothetical protein